MTIFPKRTPLIFTISSIVLYIIGTIGLEYSFTLLLSAILPNILLITTFFMYKENEANTSCYTVLVIAYILSILGSSILNAIAFLLSIPLINRQKNKKAFIIAILILFAISTISSLISIVRYRSGLGIIFSLFNLFAWILSFSAFFLFNIQNRFARKLRFPKHISDDKKLISLNKFLKNGYITEEEFQEARTEIIMNL